MKTKSIAQAPNPKLNIQMWINDLGSLDGSKRLKARKLLIKEGVNAVPGLIQALSSGNWHIRWGAAKVLAQTRDRKAASALVRALEDEDHDVRWAAMEALITLDRAGLEPLLRALMKDFDSVYLLEGAHHILHVLKDRGRLGKPMIKVFKALEGVEPEVTVPWTAEAAWESLFGPKSSA
jgi:hypothetical protein